MQDWLRSESLNIRQDAFRSLLGNRKVGRWRCKSSIRRLRCTNAALQPADSVALWSTFRQRRGARETTLMRRRVASRQGTHSITTSRLTWQIVDSVFASLQNSDREITPPLVDCSPPESTFKAARYLPPTPSSPTLLPSQQVTTLLSRARPVSPSSSSSLPKLPVAAPSAAMQRRDTSCERSLRA